MVGPVLVKDIQTLPPFKKGRFDFVVQIVEKRSETDEKRKKIDLFFVLW